MIRGPEASWKPLVTVTQSVGGGYDVDATFNFQATNYTGKVKNLTRDLIITNSFRGKRRFPTIWGAGSATAGLDIGGRGSVTYLPNERNAMIEREFNIEAGLPFGPLPANKSGGVSNTYLLHDFY